MSDTVSLQQMMADAGTTDIKLLAHCINAVAPAGPVLLEDFPASVWAGIKEDVAKCVSDHGDRYRVHALPGGKEYIESDEEYAYNRRIAYAVDRYAATKAYGEETQAVRVQRMNDAREGVAMALDRDCPDNADQLAAATDRLAFINYEYWNTAPWETKRKVEDGTADLSVVS